LYYFFGVSKRKIIDVRSFTLFVLKERPLLRSSILRSLKPDIIVEMLDMAVGFENWNKVLETADILYRCAQCIDEECRE